MRRQHRRLRLIERPTRHVSDGNRCGETAVTYPSSAESRQIGCSGLENHSQSEHADHQHKAFGAAPKIKTFGQRDVTCSGHGARNDINDREQRVQAKLACCVGCHRGVDGRSEATRESVNPDTVSQVRSVLNSRHGSCMVDRLPTQSRIHSRLVPCQSSCLSFLDTKLRILIDALTPCAARRSNRRWHDRSSLIVEWDRLHDHLRLRVV
jgi:hypothetical protein